MKDFLKNSFGLRVIRCAVLCSALHGCLANSGSLVEPVDDPEVVTGNRPNPTVDPMGPSGPEEDGASPAVVLPFEPVSLLTSLRKSKTQLLGAALTAEEVAAAADPNVASRLIDTWLADPNSETALTDFFMWAFQLSQMTGLQAMAQQSQNHPPSGNMVKFIQESMARTALWIARDHQPFTHIATTRKFMVNPTLLSWMIIVDGQSSQGEYESQRNPNYSFTLVDNANIPIEKSGNPADPDYMIWSTAPMNTDCGNQLDHRFTVDKKTYFGQVAFALWMHLNGRNYLNVNKATGGYCSVFVPQNYSRMPEAPKNTWRLVTFRQPRGSERSTPFWDFDALVRAEEILLRIPRIGYYTTPAFFAQAPTNKNNQARVTVNQAMLIGLNQVFDGRDQTPPANSEALVPDHAAVGTSCYSCHITLDPMRQFFRQDFDDAYHVQMDPAIKNMPGVWSRDGSSLVSRDIAEFGEQIAKSPQFPIAWVQKVCTWVNSAPCNEKDPELLQIAQNFTDHNFDFLAMFKEVMLSNATTYRDRSATAETKGQVFSLARSRQLCRTLSARLKFKDICANEIGTIVSSSVSGFNALNSQYAKDGYVRGAKLPEMATTPSVPIRTSIEFGCAWLSKEFIDAGGATRWRSSDLKGAFAGFATQVMGVSEADSKPVLAILERHYNDARSANLTAADALRSTFVLACTSPYVTTLGVY
jgi:hypothetical protein